MDGVLLLRSRGVSSEQIVPGLNVDPRSSEPQPVNVRDRAEGATSPTERRRDGAHGAAASASPTGSPAAGSDGRLGTATRRMHGGCLDAARADAGAVDRPESAALKISACGHHPDSPGVPCEVHPRVWKGR